jgi:aminoglycoside phosphotransferase
MAADARARSAVTVAVSIAAYAAPLLARPWHGRRDGARAARVAPAIMRRLERLDPSVAGWVAQSAHSTDAGVAVLMVGPRGDCPRAVLKVGLTQEARRSLSKECAVLSALAADPRTEGWRRLVPGVLAEGELDEAGYLLQPALRGRNAVSLLGTAPVERLQTVAAEAIGSLHERTGVSAVAGVARVDRWLAEPVRRVGRAALACRGTRGRLELSRLTAEVRTALIARRLRMSWIHGDFWLGNVLVDDGGATVTGVVDWDYAGNLELPVLDLLHLVVYTRTLVERRELGGVVRDLVEGEGWTARELSLLRSCDAQLVRDADYGRASLLLCWLRHVASNLAQSKRYLHSHVWLARNVEPVLRLFERPSRPGSR